ncbi:cytochrome P450 6A1-like [Anthonomus grandis grandis]|uniref:cytochrome P450 6A1-like n=1 Tax=Anthonomus grandis grandis TaxID=2921223 RepID=UPI0021665B38|nr:cytochrome P450 6A1-like [Anthonomus grandis grandis]
MVFLLLLVTVLPTIFYFYLKWHHAYWKRRGVPQLEPEFLYGNTRGMIRGETSAAESFLDFYKQFKAKGCPYGGIYNTYRKVFLPIDPKVIKQIMQKDFEHFNGHFPSRLLKQSILTKNLFDLEGEKWKSTRKHLTPTFTTAKIKMMYETMVEKSAGLNKMIQKYSSKNEPIDIKEVLDRFTIEIVASVGFGIECNAMEDPNSEFVMHGKIMNGSPAKPKSLYLMFLRTLGHRMVRTKLHVSENFFKNMVEENIDYREKNRIYRKDFIHMMIQLKNKGKVSDDKDVFTKINDLPGTFDIEEITAQVLLFYNGGYETAATTLTFAIFELTQHPDIQDKIREEVNRVIEKYDGALTYEAVTELTYTEQVIEETLRKHSSVSAIPRTCTKEYKLPGTETIIEKGTGLFIPILGLHRDPEYFPDPEKFDPDRFSPENRKLIKEFTYLPFGEGPRMCLGLRFALVKTKFALASLLRNYSFRLNKKTELPLRIATDRLISGVKGGIWVDVQEVHTQKK